MRTCNFCNGLLEEIDDIGTEECLKCGTIYQLLPKGDDDNKSNK